MTGRGEPAAPVVAKSSRQPFRHDPARPDIEARDLVISAVDPRWRARVRRALIETREIPAARESRGFGIRYVLNGELSLGYDAGTAVRLIPGDCAFEPPGLAASDAGYTRDCTVLEVDCRGPSGGAAMERGVVHAAERGYDPHPEHAWLACRDLGTGRASGGRVLTRLTRCVADPPPGEWCTQDAGLRLLFVVQGIYRVDYGDHGTAVLIPGDGVGEPAGLRHRVVERTRDCEILEIVGPGVRR